MIGYVLKKKWVQNINHAIWFLSSISFLFFTLLIKWNKFGRYVLILPIIYHLSPIINSINTVVIKKEKSEIYSIDCIWFNFIMVILYGIVMYVF